MAVADLSKQKPAPIADVWIIVAKLMAVISQRQRLWKVVGQRLETPEMPYPICIAQAVQANGCSPSIIAETQYCLGKIGNDDRITYFIAEPCTSKKISDFRIGPVFGWQDFGLHEAHLGGAKWKGKHGGGSYPAFTR